MEKVLIPLWEEDVAPRFDLATDAMIATYSPSGELLEERIVVLPQASPEKLCQLIQIENVNTLICGGIDEEHFQYLTWKQVRVIDAVIGPARQALERFRNRSLDRGQVMWDRT